MPDSGQSHSIEIAQRISAVAPRDWDACAGPDNPTVSHAFLSALEDSRSASARTGWQPTHLLVRDGGGRLLGAVPLYLKSHSWGEYVFDQSWAQAFEAAGGRYYPKLLSAVPFTPVPGPRLLVRPDAPVGTVDALIAGVETVARHYGVASAHVTFPVGTPLGVDADRLERAGWLRRVGLQYHWDNHGYRDFDDFLAALSARKRKAVRHERAAVEASGVRLHRLSGADLRPEHWEAFHRFYLDTTERKWGGGYLTRRFFHRLGETLADRVVLVMAEDQGRWVAGALNLLGTDTLYGRNWGSDGTYPFLHFEACYYQAIAFAIEHGLKRVEAGAQGEHKIQRGYLPVETYSLHWFRDEAFRQAVAAFLIEERRQIAADRAALLDHSPYRQAG